MRLCHRLGEGHVIDPRSNHDAWRDPVVGVCKGRATVAEVVVINEEDFSPIKMSGKNMVAVFEEPVDPVHGRLQSRRQGSTELLVSRGDPESHVTKMQTVLIQLQDGKRILFDFIGILPVSWSDDVSMNRAGEGQ